VPTHKQLVPPSHAQHPGYGPERVGLNADLLQAQTHDGGANTDSKYNGCKAVIHERHPLALHFRCASHSIHLVAQHATEADVLV